MSLAKSLQDINGRLVINLSGEVLGHANSELDNYARMRISGEIPQETPCLLFANPSVILNGVLDLFPGIFELVSLNPEHKIVADHVANCYPELTADVGHSSFKVAPPARGYFFPELIDNQLMYRTDFFDGIYSDTLKHYKRVKATPEAHPLRLDVPCPAELQEFVNKSGHPVVVLAQRQEMTSGTKVIAGHEMYRPTLEYLKDSGYSMVFAGREIMPPEWHKYDVVDYAGSQFANIRNDFHLFRLAKFGVLPSSGTNALAETQCLPYIQVNGSNPAIPPFSKNSIMLPSLWETESSGRLIHFVAQIRSNLTAGISVPNGLRVRTVSPEDVLLAVQELEVLIDDWQPRSPLQEKWVDVGTDYWESKILLDGRTLWQDLKKTTWVDGDEELLSETNSQSIFSVAESRVAQGYLERNHEELFA